MQAWVHLCNLSTYQIYTKHTNGTLMGLTKQGLIFRCLSKSY